MIGFGRVATACLLIMSAVLFIPHQLSGKDPQMLELSIEAGEPLGDALVLSSLRNDVMIALGMQELPLSREDGWSGERF